MKRPLQTVAALSLTVLSADAMVTRSKVVSPTVTRTVPLTTNVVNRSPRFLDLQRKSPRVRWPTAQEIQEQDEEDDLWDEDLNQEVSGFQELQRATGSEILDQALQSKVDEASERPDLFLTSYVSDASDLEKVGMASITEQLPGPAVIALQQKEESKEEKRNSMTHAMHSRVSPAEEIALARMIQQGVQLHNLKSNFEEKHQKEISKKEWAHLAEMDARTLRREVAGYRSAKQLLVSSNMGLVHTIVRGIFNPKGPLSYEEMIQEGSLGLLRAAELFDPERGLRFSPYASIWIKGVLSNSHVGETVKLPKREKTKFNKITQAHDFLKQQNGGTEDPTVEEVAAHLGMTVAQVTATNSNYRRARGVLSLDTVHTFHGRSGTDSSAINLMEKDKAFQADADLAERTQMQADLVAAMAQNLSAREARLLRLRYGLADGHQRSLAECAEAMGISYKYARNIASKCLKKLREATEAESLEEYLLTIA